MLNDDKFGISCLHQLKGVKHLVAGNHDTLSRLAMYETSNIFKSISFGERLKYGNWTYLLNHYPLLTDNYQEKHKVISLCGHSHTTDPFLHWPSGLIYHCEVDAHDGYPVNLEEIDKTLHGKLKT